MVWREGAKGLVLLCRPFGWASIHLRRLKRFPIAIIGSVLFLFACVLMWRQEKNYGLGWKPKTMNFYERRCDSASSRF